jgi:uracil-DNA glycosylase
MQVSDADFYHPELFAIIPMGFCYPGKGRSGDLPPREECAPLWHQKLLSMLPRLRLTLLVGQYSQAYYLNNKRKQTLTETVAAFEEYLPNFFPLVHPSPRNQIWMKRNPWFEGELLLRLQQEIKRALAD